MNPLTKHLLSKTYGKEFFEIYKKADLSKLKNARYICVDETCKVTFFETNLQGALTMFENGNPQIPFHWYIAAARHFVDNQHHSIRILIVDGSDSTVVKDLSSVWKSQFASQKARLIPECRTPEGFKKAMHAELDLLETRADKYYGEKDRTTS